MGNNISGGNTEIKHNVQLNLLKNLLPQKYVDLFINYTVNDITNNIGQGINNIVGFEITKSQLISYINQLDLYSQVVNSISSISADNIPTFIINKLVTTAINNVSPSELNNFNNSIASIQPNINADIIVITNQNLINLIENIVQNNLEISIIKKCLLSHTSNLVDTIKIEQPAANSITSTNITNSIGGCTELTTQVTIIIKNILSSLNIKITPTNTIKSVAEYLQEYQNEYNNLYKQYQLYDSELENNPDSTWYTYDPAYIKEIHRKTHLMDNIQQEMTSLQSKINILQGQSFLSLNELESLMPPAPEKGDLDISGNHSFDLNANKIQKKIINMDKIQYGKQVLIHTNNLTKNKNIDSISNADLTSNKTMNQSSDVSKTSYFFGITHISEKAKKIIYICMSVLLAICIIISLFSVWRARSTVKMASRIRSLAAPSNNNDNNT